MCLATLELLRNAGRSGVPHVCRGKARAVLDNDHSYYLRRALFHRRRLELADCPEARLCHMQLVKAYQRRLAEVRGKRVTGLGQPPREPMARATLSLFRPGGAGAHLNETC